MGNASSHSWGLLDPMTSCMVIVDNIEELLQRLVVGAEVVEASYQIDGRFYLFDVFEQVAGATGQQSQSGTESGIQPFDEGGVQNSSTLTEPQQLHSHSLTPLDQVSSYVHHSAFGISFDDLTQIDIWPGNQAILQQCAKNTPTNTDVCLETIKTYQKRTTKGSFFDNFDQTDYQRGVPMHTDGST